MAEASIRANVLICGGTGCNASESQEVLTAMKKEISRRGWAEEVRVVQTGCRGSARWDPS